MVTYHTVWFTHHERSNGYFCSDANGKFHFQPTIWCCDDRDIQFGYWWSGFYEPLLDELRLAEFLKQP
jgi:hypothetical protein